MLIALIVAGYLIGSVPVAWVVTRIHHGTDLRTLGSGNVGVLNTALSVHRWSGLLVFLAEIAKGLFAVRIAQVLDGGEPAIGFTVLATIAGTRWPIWLHGQGGRGNTAAVAALALISPLGLAILIGIIGVGRILTHSTFIGMRLALLLLPLTLGLVTMSWWMVLFGACFSLMFLSTHRPESDDHLLLKRRWPSIWAFLSAPARKYK